MSGWYPKISSKNFDNDLYSIKEFTEDTIKKEGLYLEPYQSFVRKFINTNTPYYSLMLYWSYGRGKTLGSISILENFRDLVNKENGLDKFLIITKNDTLQTVFKNELIKFPYDNPYITQLEKKRLTDPEVQKNIKNRVKLRYDFINYDEMTNRILEKDINKRLDLENRIIVIDEVQNITGNFRYISLMNSLKHVKKSRIIILSATPIMDNVEEIIYIANILNFKNPVFDINLDIDYSKLSSGYKEDLEKKLKDKIKKLYTGSNKILELKKIKNNLSEHSYIPKITSYGKKILSKSLRGKISFTEGNYKSFPKVIRHGVPVNNKENSIRVVKCYMSEYQEKVYMESLKQKSHFYKLQSDVLTMVYEAPTTKEAISKLYQKNTNMSLYTLAKYSTKLHSILSNILDNKGIHFVYSNYVDSSGTNLIETILKNNGFVNYTNNSNNLKYVKYTDSLNNQQRVDIQDIINSKENIEGVKIKVIIGSPLISEGISFKNVRHVHILEPYWNLGRNIQAEGRCIRNYSHIMLPEEQQNINVYYYVSSFKNIKIDTIDIYKYKLCEEKDKEIKEIQRLLKEIAVDCYNNKKINDKNTNKMIKDNSQECDYKKCEYECVYIDTSKIKKNINNITYNKYTDPQQIQWAEYFIKNLFNKTEIWDLNNILKFTREVNISDENCFYALENLIKYKKQFVIKTKGLGYIIFLHNLYLFKPIIVKDKKKKDTINYFLKDNNINSKNIEIKQRVIKNNENIKNIDLDFFGILKRDNSLIIVDRRNEKDRSSSRELKRGRKCDTYLKEDILSMIEYVSNKKEKISKKKDMCDSLLKEMDKKNIIFKE